MRVGVMQPYLFPYLGYFQLIHAVDAFILLDDVQYINKGWINRNYWLVNKQKTLFTFSLKKDSARSLIHQRYFSDALPKEIENFLETLRRNYKHASIFEILQLIVQNSLKEYHVVTAIYESLKQICNLLQIKTVFYKSSEIAPESSEIGQNRIIQLVKEIKGSHYINPQGGGHLYDSDHFEKENIKLSFIEPILFPYSQKSVEFIPGLSIIDILANILPENYEKYLNDFSLVSNN